MSLWTSRIKDHRIWDLMKSVRPLIDQAERLDMSNRRPWKLLSDSGLCSHYAANALVELIP